jgi:hypothetical protein
MVSNALSHSHTHIGTSTRTTYCYRYRVQHTGQGPTWSTSGEVLQIWLSVVLPSLYANNYSITLIRRPPDQAKDDIPLTTSVPAPEVLDHYTYKTRLDKGPLIQFEFWLTSSHLDLGPGQKPDSLAGR